MSSSPTTFKRSRDDPTNSTPQRPTKRSNSPSRENRNSLFKTPPTTPRKKLPFSGKEPSSRRRNSLITNFKQVFTALNKVNLSYNSPVSPQSSSSPHDDSEESESESLTSSVSPSPKPSVYLFSPSSPSSSSLSIPSFSLPPLKLQLSHEIFNIPEILHKIITHLDDDYTDLPCEVPPIRRRPLSYNHALLINGNDPIKASESWNGTVNSQGDAPEINHVSKNNIFNCLTVNKLWYSVTKDILTTKLFFTNETKWRHFYEQIKSTTSSSKPSSTTLTRSNSNTRLFILNKLKSVQQTELNTISPHITGSLQHVELYVCPQLVPPLQLFTSSTLKRLILPGSKHLGDAHLVQVARMCPQLQQLDLRQCPLVSDKSIYYVAKNCRSLRALNLSRFTNADNITDKSLYFITKYLKSIDTLGLAGCSITDRGVCKLALYRSDTLQRLSLNNCTLLTNTSVPLLLQKGYLFNIVVLEIREAVRMTNMKPLVDYQYKKWHLQGMKVLIECCEDLQAKFNLELQNYEMGILKKIRGDMSKWIDSPNDSDVVLTKL